MKRSIKRSFICLGTLVAFSALTASAEKTPNVNNLRCISAPDSNSSVTIRRFNASNPNWGVSDPELKLDGVASVNSSAVTNFSQDGINYLVFTGRLVSSTEDDLILLDLAHSAWHSVQLDMPGPHTLYSMKGELRGLFKNPSTGNEELRRIDSITGITSVINTVNDFKMPQLGVRSAYAGLMYQISKNSAGNQRTLFALNATNGTPRFKSRLKNLHGKPVQIEKFKRMVKPGVGAVLYGSYRAPKGGIYLSPIRPKTGLVGAGQRLPLSALVEGHTMVTNGKSIFVLGTDELDSQRLASVSESMRVSSAPLTDADGKAVTCAILRFHSAGAD